jgi:DNA (cytosine-5)-methyltransferase 1
MIYGSVCSGIEAASLAWETLGWTPAWFAEIEPFPSAVLAHHWPQVINLGDMTKIAARVTAGEIECPDVLVGGTPCQAFSVAGLRAGLEDARGQLTLSYVELANAIDAKRRERGEKEAIIVWENVPGVLSSRDNAFGCFLAGLAGESEELQPPGGKWSDTGCVYGPQRTIAWVIKDAQYFEVAQRRCRVFVVASARKDIDPAKILFEFEGVRRDTPPSREAGQTVTGTLSSRTPAGGGLGTDFDCDGGLTPVSALTANGVGTCGADDNQALAGHLIAYGGGNTTGEIDVAACITAHGQRLDFDVETFALAFPERMSGTQVAAIENVSPAIMSRNPTAIAFAENNRSEIRLQNGDGLITGPLSAGGGKHGQGYPAVATSEPYTLAIRGRDDGSTVEVRNDGTANALLTPNGGRAGMGVGAIGWGMQVRRLTPRECERLQGMPDNYTLIPWRGKEASDCPDGPRYRAIGNSMAVPVMRWIGQRIDAVVADVEPAPPVNQYVAALDLLRSKSAHKLKEIGDQWRTPDSLFWGINAMFGPLVLDLFADETNAKCETFYSPVNNALMQDWSAALAELNGAAFANPPYSRASQHDGQYITGMRHIMTYATEMRARGGRYVFLVKAATGEIWWPEAADHISFIRGRVGYEVPKWYKPADGEPLATTAGFSAVIVVFDKTWRGPAMGYINRDDLITRGETALAQMRWMAPRLIQQQNQPQNISTSGVAA